MAVPANDNKNPMTREMARALADAGYMPLAAYLELCRKHGWS